ncbi:MAG: DUF302 domain-containing protein [Roseobacter sp.]
MRHFLLVLLLIAANGLAAGDIQPRAGWIVLPTDKTHSALLTDLRSAVKANKMGVVTQAGPTATARQRGIDIPENRVVGVFNNKFAVEVLATSTAAMIEAPIRFYLTANEDGSATLSYKTPSFVFDPYMDEGGDDLAALASTLDRIFDRIAQQAIR